MPIGHITSLLMGHFCMFNYLNSLNDVKATTTTDNDEVNVKPLKRHLNVSTIVFTKLLLLLYAVEAILQVTQ